MKPIIGITMGDASGIGPEIILKVLKSGHYKKFCNLVVIGNKRLIDYTLNYYRYKLYTKKIDSPEDIYRLSRNTVGIIDVGGVVNGFELGHPSKAVGEIALKCIDTAVELAKHKKIVGIVTAPVNKEVVALSYKKFTGHTEYIADKLGVNNYNMVMVSKKIKVALVTTHIAIKDVAKKLNKAKIRNTILNSSKMLEQLGKRRGKIAVLALNPHSGDGGLFGNEEARYIKPVINDLQKKGINVSGPYVPDTFFVEYQKNPEYDVVVAMYHDQGLIPFKMLSFGSGINVTIGLPIIRTSVDHGTAYNIAGKNKADSNSLFEAIKFAVRLSGNTAENKIYKKRKTGYDFKNR